MHRFCENPMRIIENWMRPIGMVSLAIFCLLSVETRAYKLLGVVWDADSGPVEYHLEPNGSDDISDGSDLEAIRDAFRRWACAPGSSLRFVESAAPGVKEVSLEDGINTLFWDEDGSFGLGPGTLGVTIGSAPANGGSMVIQDAADIVFNGYDSTWGTTEADATAGKVDVASIAIHEIGHWLGLGHPCEDPQESQCLGPEDSVMTPTYPGGLSREPLPDDIDGLVALYPATDASRCDGPYRQGEVCSCNDECVTGLLCIEGLDGTPVCSSPCSGANATCPVGYACVLGAQPTNGGVAPGTCLRLARESQKPLSSLCERDSECAAGVCIATSVVGRTVCRKSCDTDADCPLAYHCVEDVCVAQGADEGTVCPEDIEEAGCRCSSSPRVGHADTPISGLAAILFLGFRLRRRKKRTLAQ